MRLKTALSVFIPVLGVLAASAVLQAASLEDTYFETRDRFIDQFWNGPKPGDDAAALVELEKQMRALIGPVQIEGFPHEGGINLDTLHNELGFGKLDGLRFDAERETVVVTTARLLDEYLRVRKLPSSLGELSKTGDFYFGVFFGDAAVTHYAQLPVKVANSETFAYAFLGLVAQDIGPYVPTTVFAFVKNGSRITIASAPSQQEVNQIPACQQEWEDVESKAEQAFALYKASQFKNKEASDNNRRYEEEGFRAYVACFGREAKSQRFFPSLAQQAQSMVDRLKKLRVE